MNKRLSAILLALLMLSAVSCGDSTTAETASAAAETEPAETEYIPTIAETLAEKYAGTDYEGHTFRIMGYAPGAFFYYKINEQANEIWYESMTGDSYNDAVYQRNAMTEDLLNITIQPEWNSEFDITPKIKQLVAAGDQNVEAALGAMAHHINIAVEGNLYNLHDVSSVELESEWYDQSIVKNYSYKNKKLYAIAGAYNIFDDYGLPVLFYGRNILNLHSLQDPAELVLEGKWTIEAMMQMAETVSMDLNGDGKMTIDDDSWGFTDNSGGMKHMMEGIGHTITRVDSEGLPYVNWLTPDFLDAVDYVYHRIFASDGTIEIADNGKLVSVFKEERILFYYELLGCINEFREMESSFSLLPLPKYNEEQENYITPVNSVWCTAFAIPVTAEDAERTGTIFNVLSAFSVDTVNKTLYELILGSKLIREETSLVMLDHVWANKQYCWGNGYAWASPIETIVNNQFKSTSFIMASQLQKQGEKLEAALADFLQKFEELP